MTNTSTCLSVICVLLFCYEAFSQYTKASEYRTYDGTNNNLQHPNWGKAGAQLLRYGGINGFEDGISQPRGYGTNLASPRQISNVVFNHYGNNYGPENPRQLTDYVTYWGQFLDHDIDLTPAGNTEDWPIPVPTGDPYFDPYSYGNATIGFHRSEYDPTSGTSTNNPRQHFNIITSFVDGSQVYGSDQARANALRLFLDGKLNTTGSNMPPKLGNRNFFMANDAHVYPDSEMYFVGDVRGNENPALTSLHVIFVREHNRWCDILKAFNSSWDDETLYQEARRRVIAILQRITFFEYLPVTIGESLSAYTGYNASVNPTIMTEFSSGAFRYGHSEVNSYIWRLGADWSPIPQGHLRLLSSYFNSSALDLGIDSVLRGMALQVQHDVDPFFVEDLRNYLFGRPGQGGFDLTAINTWRARDHGVPGFNTLRQMFGLTPYATFSELTDDSQIATALASVYATVDDCDIYVCGLAEKKPQGANVGFTFTAIIKIQYERLRVGDRFWYENSWFSPSEIAQIEDSTLAKVIVRNSNIQQLQCFVMSSPDGCTVEPPVQTSSSTGPGLTTGLPVGNWDFYVAVSEKTPAHPFYGVGFNYGYVVNGVEGPNITLQRGITYRFKADMGCSHRVYITTNPVGNGAGFYDTNVVNNEACIGDILSFTPDNSTPDTLYYQCAIHDSMGGPLIIVGTTSVTTGGVNPVTTGTFVAPQTTGAQMESGAEKFVVSAFILLAMLLL